MVSGCFINLRRVTEGVLFSVASQRPKRINQGRGGAVAQLQAISEQLTGTEKGRQKSHKNSILVDTPADAMAPVGRRTAVR
jgi:hypothetical protein